MKLTIHPSFGGRKLSRKEFIISHILILVAGLSFIFGLYYILNLQYPQNLKPFEKGPVTSAPKTLRLELEQPDFDVLSFESSVIVSGKTSPLSNILIFSDKESIVLKSDLKGSFLTVFDLEEGINHIRVEVFDLSGDKKTDERIVYFSKEGLE